MLANPLAAVDDRPRHQFQGDMLRKELRERRDTAEDREIRSGDITIAASIPPATAYSAKASPAFPCVGTANFESPSALAIETVSAMPRSLNESVGLPPNPG